MIGKVGNWHDDVMLSALLAFCEGNLSVDSPHKGPFTQTVISAKVLVLLVYCDHDLKIWSPQI